MGKIRVKGIYAAFLLLPLLLGSCKLLENFQNASGPADQRKPLFGKNGVFYTDGNTHSSASDSGEALSIGSNIKRSKTPFGGAPSGTALVKLPADRCRSGYLTFGPLNGEYFKCEALGRGITRWTEKNPATYKVGTKDPVSGRDVRIAAYGKFSRVTQVDDWKSGRTSTGRRCWYFDSRFTAGKTPVGVYNINDVTSSKSSWGGMNGVYITPKNFKTHRGELFVHSSDQFGANTPIDEPAFSTVGCVRVRPDCQILFNQWAKQNKGKTLEVKE